MNARKCISTAPAFILLVLLVLTTSTSLYADEEQDYQAAINQNTGYYHLRQLRYDRAVRTRKLEHWEEFSDAYQEPSPPSRFRDPKKDEEMREKARNEIERLLYEKIAAEPSLELCRDYMKRCPEGIHKHQVIVKMEPFLFDEAVRTNQLKTYFDYLEQYPKGYRNGEIRKRLDPVLFKNAQSDDWYSSYEEYIKKCPAGEDVQKAKDRIKWLKSHPAIAEINFPKVLRQEGGRYEWDTVFLEKGGISGFKVEGRGHIHDARGGIWSWTWLPGTNLYRGQLTVKAGETVKTNYWFGDRGDHTFCNGYASFTWTGEDAGGQPIRLEERVDFPHTGCPGPEKK